MRGPSKLTRVSCTSRGLVQVSLSLAAIILLLGPLSSHLYAAVQVQLTPSSPAPQPVGTTVSWTASATDSIPGSLDYQFSVEPPAEGFRVARDFSPRRVFEWTPSEREGAYLIKVIARNTSTQERAELMATYTISSRVNGQSPVISSTAHPLVALYSAPPCSAGSMRVNFWRTGDSARQTTPWKSCRPGSSMNFYIAGMLAATQYSMQHEISSRAASPVETGPTLFFTTGTPPQGMFPAASVLIPSGESEQGVLLNFNLASSFYLTASDLSGQGLWYYHKPVRYGTRPLPGGTMLVVLDDAGTYDTLREIDLAGNTLRETNINRVSEQLAARGEQAITSFHHEARRLPDGRTLVLCSNDRILSDVQGSGPVDILGDMIVVLDEDWQVVWAWNAFDHLDVRRKATLDDKCTTATCPPNFPNNSNDWLHSNSVSYSTLDGNLLLSVRHQDWVIKIDYRDGIGTGDVLWRLGKDGDFTINSADPYPWFSHQHDAEFELGGASVLTLYDNGNTRRAALGESQHSRGQVWNIDEAKRTATLQMNVDLGAYSFALGSAQRLANGDYHFLSGLLFNNNHSQSTEVRPDGSISFRVEHPAPVYRSFRMRDLYSPASFGQTDSEDAQTISFASIGDQTSSREQVELSATASSGLPVSFRIMSGPAIVSGNRLTLKGGGTVVVQAEQGGNANYNAAPSVSQSFNVNRPAATITLSNLAQTYDGTAKHVTVTTIPANLSGLSISYSRNGQPVEAPTDAGTYTVLATVNDAIYTGGAAGTLIIGKANQTISFGALPGKSYGDAPFTISATAQSGLPVSFRLLSGAASISGNTVTITGAGVVTLRASQAGNENYNAAADVDRSFTVSTANASVTLTSSANPSDFGQEVSFKASVSSLSTVPGVPTGTVTFTVDGSAQPPVALSNGTAQWSTSSLSVGQHNISAAYNGGSDSNSGTATLAGGQMVKAQPTLSLNDLSFTEGNSGTFNATFTVTLSAASSLPVTVNYRTLDGTASAGSDYEGVPVTALALRPGETTGSINVAVKGDTLNEADETFFLNLSDPVNAALLKAQGKGTILNDDTPLVQFGNASYSLSEAAGSAQITVVRSGDSSSAATVDYSTSDKTANQRTDYTTASGRLSFSPGEVSKSFAVLVIDNAFPDGNRTVNLMLSNPSGDGIALGAQSAAVLTIIDNDTAAPTTNPIDNAQSFVRQQYMDFLNREPDAGGLAYWSGEINRCGGDAQCIHDRRVGVADAFFFEPEFQQTGAYVYRIYKASLGLKPTYAQFINDRGRVVAGPGLDQSKNDYALYFVRSAGFQQEYATTNTADQFVDGMLAVVKSFSGVDLSAQRGALINLYDGTDSGRAAILKQVAESQAFIAAEYNNSFVLMEYFGYLRRDPDQGGFDFWLAQVKKFPLRHVGIQHAMACSFITSAEYQTRFSSVVTHTNHECPQ